MPIPALLATLLPYIGTAAAGFAGSQIANSLSGNTGQPNPMKKPGQKGGISSSALPSQGNFFTGSPSQVHQLPRFSPEQIQSLDQARQMGFQGLQGNKFDFGPIENIARRDFQRKTIPGIAERFAGAGAINSGAYGRQLGQAGTDLETNLAGLRSGYNLQQQDFYKNLLGLGLQNQFDTKIEAAAPGFGQNFAGGLAQSSPDLIKLLLQYLSGGK